MIDSLIEAVKTVDRSARHVVMGAAVTLVVIAALIAYGASLQEARLAGLERSAALLRDSKTMLQDASDPALQEAGAIVRIQAIDILHRSVAPTSYSAYEKFGYAIVPWVLLIVVNCFHEERQGLLGGVMNSLPQILCGTAFGLIGAFLPDSPLPWFNMLVYPAGHFLIFVAIMFSWVLNKPAPSLQSDETTDGETDNEDRD
jgi:hypothetical protein